MDTHKAIEAVCMFHQAELGVLTSSSKVSSVVWIRHELMYVMHYVLGMKQSDIGELLGGRNHQTVSSGISRVAERRTVDSEYDGHVADLVAFVRRFDPPPMVKPALTRARRVVACEHVSSSDAQHCGITLLSAASVLASPNLTDAEARMAALQIMGAQCNG